MRAVAIEEHWTTTEIDRTRRAGAAGRIAHANAEVLSGVARPASGADDHVARQPKGRS